MPLAVKALGLPPACRFVVGCLDQYAGAVGAGNISPGAVSETTGTVLAAVRCAAEFDSNAGPNEYQGPAYAPGLYYRMSFGSTSANLLEWFRNQQADRPEFEKLGAEAERVPPGSDGFKVKARADQCASVAEAFVGMDSRHGRGHQVRCIMEAVAFALRDHLTILCGRDLPTLVRATGGAARSDLWLQIKADVLGVPFAGTTCPEPTSLGAAMLAASALGWGSMQDLAAAWVATRPSRQPDLTVHARYVALGSPVMGQT